MQNTGATMTRGGSSGRPAESAPPQGAQPMAAFTRASIEHDETSGVRGQGTISASAQQFGPGALASYGYLSAVMVLVTLSGGVAGNATVAYQPDAPWSVLQEVVLQDVNGTPIVQLTGYELYLANLFGGYQFQGNPASWTPYSAPSSAGNMQFMLQIPVQIRQRDALGCLPNMNAASAYQLKFTVAPSTDIYSTPPDTLPTFAVESWIEAWAKPQDINATGQPNAIQPPALGTTQFWTRQAGIATSIGQNQFLLTRVGNLARTIILIGRTSAGVRSDSVLLSSYQLNWDANMILDETTLLRRTKLSQRFGGTTTVPTGVSCVDLTHSFDGHPGGGDLADLWYPTASSSRIEFKGTAAAAGSTTILMNDVIPGGDVWRLG